MSWCSARRCVGRANLTHPPRCRSPLLGIPPPPWCEQTTRTQRTRGAHTARTAARGTRKTRGTRKSKSLEPTKISCLAIAHLRPLRSSNPRSSLRRTFLRPCQLALASCAATAERRRRRLTSSKLFAQRLLRRRGAAGCANPPASPAPLLLPRPSCQATRRSARSAPSTRPTSPRARTCPKGPRLRRCFAQGRR